MRERAKELAAQGGTNVSIAKELGIAVSTLSLWMKDSQDFSDSLKAGKAVADDEVESALHRRAVGFTAPDGTYHPPHPTACVFWLKNRLPDQWRDSNRQELTGADGAPLAPAPTKFDAETEAKVKAWAADLETRVLEKARARKGQD